MCTKNQLEIITKAVASVAKETLKEKLVSVILYGSYARGDFDDESDIDIMVLVDIPREELYLHKEPFLSLSSKLGLDYDIVVSVTLKDIETFNQYLEALPFYTNVKREGIRIAV